MQTQIDLNIEETSRIIGIASDMRDGMLECDYGYCRHIATALVITVGEARPGCPTHTTRMINVARGANLTPLVINKDNIL